MSSTKKTKNMFKSDFFKILAMFFDIFSEPEQQQLVKQRLWDEGPTLREEDEILREEDEVIFQILFLKLFFIFQKIILLSKFQVEIDDGFYDVTLKNNDTADEGEVLSLPADTEGNDMYSVDCQ